MTHYFKSGNRIDIQPEDALSVSEKLPVGTYTVKVDPRTEQLFLQTTNDFVMPKKIYGNTLARTDRVINTFNSRPKTTGVLLVGDKGSGKTLLAKNLSIELAKQGVSTLIINEALCGDDFNTFIGNIKDPALVIFDEYEKIYKKEDQERLLTLFDGTVESKKLFVLTTNSKDIDSHMINRPGRMFYQFNYEGLDEGFIREYVADTMVQEKYTEELVLLVNMFATFTFDMLQALVEEINRYGESPKECLDYLNIDITREFISYDVEVLINGGLSVNSFYPMIADSNPLLSECGYEVTILNNGRKIVQAEAGITTKPGRGKFVPQTTARDPELEESAIDGHHELECSTKSLEGISKGGTLTFKFVAGGKDVHVIFKKRKKMSMKTYMAF